MSNASAKEPSMDEILSSIRQIIADDDAGLTPPAPPPLAAETPGPAAAIEPPQDDPADEDDPTEEALSLSTEQIVEEDAATPELDDDPMVAFEADAAKVAEDAVEVVDFEIPDMVEPDDITFSDDVDPEVEAPPPVVETRQPVHEPAMPDPKLSADIAEQLLEPVTGDAVKATFSKLSNLSLGTQSITIENMIREMLRPMLKDWLDENLPSVVEKMVEKEIERISRGS